MSDSTDLSPWAHPKAKRWFTNLIEENTFALAVDDELAQSINRNEFDKIRAILALAILLGREGVWPEGRANILRSVVRAAAHVSKGSGPEKVGGPMTMAEHQGHTLHDDAIHHELELLRRRLKMSNRKSQLDPPATWGNLWE